LVTPGDTDENHENPPAVWHPDQDFKREPPDYEAKSTDHRNTTSGQCKAPCTLSGPPYHRDLYNFMFLHVNI